MIVFDLKCPSEHVFESWFGSTEDYEQQRQRGLVECPLCGARDLVKAAMAPHLPAKANSRASSDMASAHPEAVKAMLAAMAKAQKKMLESSHFVGDRFADEARAIHIGDAEARAIHGKATRDEADSLIQEGIPVAPLPFPVVEPSEEN
ncbi:DUF1178 family protein [Sphingosinicella rhizophila]|uniref:DUF1178 family protein n=1 Tax=Sphingosinicella rhizophila TaxID=3050082 RepID=A0ABU3Q356_9SPHN|nr:DUF1178 family protein [Sphingosinicella sp. GR2756]MDT9597846.1 DUF1178 family protein [Sphingosinicella sp. GR2756]